MHKCEMCERQLPKKTGPDSVNWDWFTGWLSRTVHFCPMHKNTPERHGLFRLSRKKPDNYDDDRNARHSV